MRWNLAALVLAMVGCGAEPATVQYPVANDQDAQGQDTCESPCLADAAGDGASFDALGVPDSATDDGGCSDGTPIGCDDGDPCTNDLCVDDACSHQSAACDDGLLCKAGKCVKPWPVALAAGFRHTCAVLADGTARCWGDNAHGLLGDGGEADSPLPVEVAGLGAGVTAMALGAAHSCALLSGSDVMCWGANDTGQLGNGTISTFSATPTPTVRLGANVTAIAAGGSHTCAVLANSTVKCWGSNAHGQLQSAQNTPKPSPVLVSAMGGVHSVVGGEGHTCALLEAGPVTCWGWNNTGQLGNGTLKPAYAPVAVSGLGTEPTASIASRANHTCALLTGGSVKCWGQNFDGQLGDGTSEHATAAVPVLGLGAGSTVAVAAGSQHTCALLANGAVRCWGLNKRGQLGDATTTDTDSPVPVGDLGGVALAVVTGGWHTCALLEAGTIQCWGRNAEGQLGDGTVVDRNSPVYVVGFGG